MWDHIFLELFLDLSNPTYHRNISSKAIHKLRYLSHPSSSSFAIIIDQFSTSSSIQSTLAQRGFKTFVKLKETCIANI